MERNYCSAPAALLRKGLRELAAHRPDRAVSSLRAAVEATKPTSCAELGRALYWLSIALVRLGNPELAVKSLASAQKVKRRGFVRRAYLRQVNEYGMPRRASRELDDFYAFASIKIAAYLRRKTSMRFDSMAEREMVLKLVSDAWLNVKQAAVLSSSDSGQKIALFHAYTLHVPAFGFAAAKLAAAMIATAPQAQRLTTPGAARSAGTMLYGAYNTVAARCSCGSGLPHTMCCGRIASLREL